MSRPCNHWAQFKCNFGDACGFSHDGPGGADPRGLYQGVLGKAPGGGAGAAAGGMSAQDPTLAYAEALLTGQYAQMLGGAAGFAGAALGGSDAGGGDVASDNVFVTQMPEGLDEETVKTILGQYGTVLSTKIVSKPGQAWTACLARFSSVEEATEIVNQLNGQIPNGLQTPIQVKFADRPRGAGGPAMSGASRFSPYEGGGKGGGKGGTTMDDIIRSIEDSGALPGGDGKSRAEHIEMFVLGLPPDCTDIHLYKMMAPFGQIGAKGVKVVSNKEDGSCMGYGFVNFLAQESAAMAIETLNGAQMPNGKTLRVEQKKAKGEGKGARAA